MKALILAAGVGSRLAPLTDTLPKSLIPVCGMPILFRQIENLHQNNITDITVVSGYHAELLKGEIERRYSDIHILYSEHYAVTNNMYSAYLARNHFAGEAFLMMNADVFFDASVIETLLRFPAPNAIVTEAGRWMEESMKVRAQDGCLREISKTIPPEDAYGTAIDVYKFSAVAGTAFFDACRRYIEERGEVQKWSEVALNAVLPDIEFQACPLTGRWMEIDTHEDLCLAEELFGGGI